MKVFGIVSEFNPFHNGHAALIEETRRMGATHIVSVMSGDFVQRGEPAVFSAQRRTRAALLNGVDLVLRLPVFYSLSGAENFARGAVEILNGTGIIDCLVFGSECGDISKLREISSILDSDEFAAALHKELDTGITFAKARQNAVGALSPDLAPLLGEPNNILGIEYIKALKNTGSRIEPVTVRRKGASHGGGEICGNIASGEEIRRRIAAGEEWKSLAPARGYEDGNCRDDMVISDRYDLLVLYRMHSLSKDEISRLPDISEGIENRIFDAASAASTANELYERIKTKRYTLARIRRTAACAAAGITKDDAAMPAPYIRAAGFNANGAALMKEMKGTATLPVVTKAADTAALPDTAKRAYELECAAADIYSLCLEKPLPKGEEKRRKIMIIDSPTAD